MINWFERYCSPSRIFILYLIISVFVTGCSTSKDIKKSEEFQTTPKLLEIGFADLHGWHEDNHSEALKAFAKSCSLLVKSGKIKLNSLIVNINKFNWKLLCNKIEKIDDVSNIKAKFFFERWFTPYKLVNSLSDNLSLTGLFTGYYEAELNGSWIRTKKYNIPIYKKPNNLISIDLGQFSSSLRGERSYGRLHKNKLIPYFSRKDIDNGALHGKNLELLWVDNLADAFFLHVQGSGRVRLTDGKVVRVGYAGKNGLPYVSIGRVLVKKGLISLEHVSMESIRSWINAYPIKALKLLQSNQSYIFFRQLRRKQVIGSIGVGLTPGRSLAVDTKYIPMGLPIWLDTNDPLEKDLPLQRLLITQDTGSAIKGIIRGDVFWGFGNEAQKRAGFMKSKGTYYLLIPKI